MTRKDYELIAKVFKKFPRYTDELALNIEVLATELGKALEQDNPRFDRARFLDACGVN